VDGGVDAQAPSEAGAGAAVVGTRRIEIPGPGGRTLPVQLWYPAQEGARAEAEHGHALEEIEPAGPRREQLKALIAAARAGCPNLTFHAALDAPPLAQDQPFPLVVYSHHFSGSRFSMFEIAESLAREGLVVAAPDHVKGSLFDRKDSLTDSLTQLNNDFLQLRVADLKGVLDTLLDRNAQQLPAELRGRLDPARVGAMGHSQGGMTVGVLSVEDTRVKATAYLAIPPSATPAGLVFSLPSVARFRTPGLYLTAHEDSVVAGGGGEQAIAACFDGQAPRAYWIDVQDTGHFSFADDCALAPEFDECCGTGKRAVGGASYMFLAPERARSIAAHYSAAFFAAELRGATPTRLTTPEPAELVSIKQHGQRDAGP
jgi:predicted dienelactone hydrolase